MYLYILFELLFNKSIPSGIEVGLKSGGPGIERWHCHTQRHDQSVHSVILISTFGEITFFTKRDFGAFSTVEPRSSGISLSLLPVATVTWHHFSEFANQNR